jgi:hypothetical protein
VRPLIVAIIGLLLPATAFAVRDAGGVLGTSPARTQAETAEVRAPGKRGEIRVVRAGPAHGTGLRFSVGVEGRLRVDPRQFAETVAHVLNDRRGWRARGYSFQRVASGPVYFTVVLASPALTDQLCAPLQTLGRYSCAQGGRIVINYERWRDGTASYRSLNRYRVYMVNHEVGHILGRGHAYCSGAMLPAPVMVQQTKGVAPCRANPWPLEYE